MGQSLNQAIGVLKIYGYRVRVQNDILCATHSDEVEFIIFIRDAEVHPASVQFLITRENRRRAEIEDKLRDKAVLESYHK